MIFLERRSWQELLSGNSHWVATAGLLGPSFVCYSCRAFVYFHSVPALPCYVPRTFLLMETHMFSQGETTWILKAQLQIPEDMCINNLVFQLVSQTTQHKPSKENSTCVLTAPAWWKIGFLGKIISKRGTYLVWLWVWCPSQKWVGNSQTQSMHRVSFLCKNLASAEIIKPLTIQEQLWHKFRWDNNWTIGRKEGHSRGLSGRRPALAALKRPLGLRRAAALSSCVPPSCVPPRCFLTRDPSSFLGLLVFMHSFGNNLNIQAILSHIYRLSISGAETEI